MHNIYRILARLFPDIIWFKKTTRPEVYFTFDDGPHPEFTPQVLDILKDYNSRATFFLVGERVGKYPDIVSRILEEGHTIALHSYSHKMLIFKSRRQLIYELLQPQKDLHAITAINPIFFRPPYGKFTPQLIKRCHQLGVSIVMWTIMSYDFNLKISAQKIKTKISQLLKDGVIIVFHDGHKNSARTVKILPDIIEDVLDRGKILACL